MEWRLTFTDRHPGSSTAREKRTALLALTLKSSEADLREGHGYYYPAKGAGSWLREELQRTRNAHPALQHVPVYLFGFSGGAHFVHRYANWSPTALTGFVAYAAGWWSAPTPEAAHLPALILCGYQDDRFDDALAYFRAGRERGAPWCFVRVRHSGHKMQPEAVVLAQQWITASLSRQGTDSTQTTWSGNLFTLEIWLAFYPPASPPHPLSTVIFPNEIFARQWRQFNLI